MGIFKKIGIDDVEPLNKFSKQVSLVLTESVKDFRYPDSLRTRSGAEGWYLNVQKIVDLNSEILGAVSKRSGVYAIYVARTSKLDFSLRYVGQVDGSGCRQRVRSHLVWRNKETPSGRFTGSKFDEVKSAVTRGFDIGFSFVEINPPALRHYVEHFLIKRRRPEWNVHGAGERTPA